MMLRKTLMKDASREVVMFTLTMQNQLYTVTKRLTRQVIDSPYCSGDKLRALPLMHRRIIDFSHDQALTSSII
ncbi:hypothetical protein NPIL_552691 [Nephila pilipes]|uniref:Uncharacterized protein n=1 Tax=Nephila pilipes TaxID=299642 RepID=A0A8X6NT37_NEPPI|nr:hypothetical protein NPIL_552691 [Nephila pilipes]